MADTIKVKLVKSLASRQKDQIEIVKSLGLRKIGDCSGYFCGAQRPC